MQDLLADYPDNAGAAQARSVLIAANVARATPDPIPCPRRSARPATAR
jgi:hypothetical protein